MVTRGWWNVHKAGKWYQLYKPSIGRISSPGDMSTYSTAKNLQDGTQNLDQATLIPFPLPLRREYNYVYTLDLDSSHLTLSFLHGDDVPNLALTMRRIDLDSIRNPSDLSINSLMENGSNPLLHVPEPLPSLREQEEQDHERLAINFRQPTPTNELQYRMFVDFVHQWRFFIDDHQTWQQQPSSLLFRRLAIAFLRLAAWDFEISSEWKITRLPLGGETYPRWECPAAEIYWFHRCLVVLCADLSSSSSVAAAVSRARLFLAPVEKAGKPVTCILISLFDITLVQISRAGEKPKHSAIFPLLTKHCNTDCSAGFRLLTHFLTRPDYDFQLIQSERDPATAREKSQISRLPTEVLDMVLHTVSPHDIISFAQASFVVGNWYYSSLTQFPNVTIRQFDLSIPCCGKRVKNDESGVFCYQCYIWQHTECLARGTGERNEGSTRSYTCSKCLSVTSKERKLAPGALQLEYRRHLRPRPAGCPVLVEQQEKTLHMRVSAPAIARPYLRLRDPDLTSTPPEQIDYVVLFGGAWGGICYGLD